MTHGFDYNSVDWNSIFKQIKEGSRGTMTRISAELGIDKATLSRLNAAYQANPQIDISSKTWGGSNRQFTPKQEENFTRFFINDLASNGAPLPNLLFENMSCHIIDYRTREEHARTIFQLPTDLYIDIRKGIN